MRLTLSIVIGLAMLLLTGCTGVRMVIDLVPARDDLTETVVLEDDFPRFQRPPKVAMIDVTGLIIDARRPGLLTEGENPVAEFLEALKKAENDDRVRAVLIRINSPGGTVTASDVMYRELVRFRTETGKPVVILMSDLAASGGYYLACAGDHVIAHPTTITGSIGVIIQTFNFSEGMRRVGIRADSIVSGDKKNVGSPFEPMPPEHRSLLQGLVDEFHAGFVTVVTDRRPELPAASFDQVMDGRVVTGRQAHELGLIDEVGDLHDAFEAAKILADLPKARLVKYHRPLQHVGSAYATAPVANSTSQINLLQLNLNRAGGGLFEQPAAYYLWDPVAFGMSQ